MIALLIALMLFMGCVLQPQGTETAGTPEQDLATETPGATAGGEGNATTASQGNSTAEIPPTPTIVSARQASRTQYSSPPALALDASSDYVAEFRTSLGNFRVELLATQAPVTVNNFVFLAKQGFYDGLIFHRVIESFMVQGGDPTGTGSGGPGYQFEDEIVPGLAFDTPGRLAMANSGPNTNGSQFFITTAATEWLNGRHTIFGRVTEGQQVVGAISRVNTGPRDVPTQQVMIESIDILQTPRQ